MVIKLKYYKNVILVGFFLVIYSCGYLDNTKNYKKINSNSEFNIVVEKIRIENGVIINDKYYYGSGVFLQKNNNYPEWVLNEIDKNYGDITIYEDGRILLDIDMINRPFEIYKKTNSNILNLVKNNDTLQFRIYY